MGTSRKVLTIYDEPLWDSIRRRRLWLQACSGCGTVRYPPGPVCHVCLATEYAWEEVSGNGEILSWVIFHRAYLDDHPPPYNVIAVKLEEGPVMINNLVGEQPAGTWIGRKVVLCYCEAADRVLPQFRLVP